MISGHSDGTVRVWNIMHLDNTAKEWTDHEGSVNAVLFSPDKKSPVIVSGGADQRVIVRTAAGDIRHRIEVGSIVQSIAIALPDLLVVGTRVGMMSVKFDLSVSEAFQIAKPRSSKSASLPPSISTSSLVQGGF